MRVFRPQNRWLPLAHDASHENVVNLAADKAARSLNLYKALIAISAKAAASSSPASTSRSPRRATFCSIAGEAMKAARW